MGDGSMVGVKVGKGVDVIVGSGVEVEVGVDVGVEVEILVAVSVAKSILLTGLQPEINRIMIKPFKSNRTVFLKFSIILRNF